MATIKSLITRALRRCGVVGIGKTPAAYLLADGLNALNSMLDSWSGESKKIYIATRETLLLTSGQVNHTIGSGGNLDTTRPVEIFDSFITISNTDYPVRVISRDQYDRISDKTVEGRPFKMYYQPSFPLGNIKFYYEPDSAYSLTLISLKPFSVYALADTYSWPQGYERAIEHSLVIELASLYGFPVPIEVAAVAKESLKIIENRNMANRVPLQRGLSIGRSGEVETGEDLFR